MALLRLLSSRARLVGSNSFETAGNYGILFGGIGGTGAGICVSDTFPGRFLGGLLGGALGMVVGGALCYFYPITILAITAECVSSHR